MAFGFALSQSLGGSYHRLNAPGEEHPLRLELKAQLPLLQLIAQQSGQLRGTLDAPGYAEDKAIEGKVSLKLAEGKLVYEFRFVADDGRPRRFYGETEVHLRRLRRTLEDLVGRVYDEEEEELRVIARVPLDIGLLRLLRGARAHFSRTL